MPNEAFIDGIFQYRAETAELQALCETVLVLAAYVKEKAPGSHSAARSLDQLIPRLAAVADNLTRRDAALERLQSLLDEDDEDGETEASEPAAETAESHDTSDAIADKATAAEDISTHFTNKFTRVSPVSPAEPAAPEPTASAGPEQYMPDEQED